MTQREFVISVVRLAGAFLAVRQVFALAGQLLLPADFLSNVEGVGAAIAIQCALLFSGHLVANVVCRPEC